MSDLEDPPKAPEGGQGIQLTEEKQSAEDKPAGKQAPAISSEPAKADNAPAEPIPAATLANGDKPETAEPPTMTGALRDEAEPATILPNPANPPARPLVISPGPADDAVKEGAAASDKPVEQVPKAPAPAESGVSDAAKANGGPAATGGAETKEASAAEAAAAPAGDKAAAPAPEEAAVAGKPVGNGKRKAEEHAPTNGEAKKAKTEEAASGDSAANGASGPKKPGRPKKNKEPVTVGRTARKTRSQGPIEG